MSFTTNNHYVPIWFQRRFLSISEREPKLYYLDLKPDKIARGDGGHYFRNDLRRLGPIGCFYEQHLYTQFFGNGASDAIEKFLFGKIDTAGAAAVHLFGNYAITRETSDAFSDLLIYLGAQTFRTPKGLGFLQLMVNNAPRQDVLSLLPRMSGVYSATWAEGVWEIFSCDKSDTKFIISDHPVTLYNRKVFPGSKAGAYPFDARIGSVGTQTLFPLDLNTILVITNLQLVRNPRMNPLKVRENFRLNSSAFFNLESVHTGRQLSERDVRSINYILKRRASRYIASGEKEWLYPEKYLKTTLWNKLGDEFFLMPDPRTVPFTTSITVGFDVGSVKMDEYGRPSDDKDPKVQFQRQFEQRAFREWQKRWDMAFGELSVEEQREALLGRHGKSTA